MPEQKSSMRPVVIGGIVAVLVIAAFVFGQSVVDEPDGPAEKLGEQIDKAAGELKEGAEEVREGLENAAN